MSRHQISDGGFKIGGLDVSFPIGAPIVPKIVLHEIDRPIRAIGHDRRGPACSRHMQLPQTQTLHCDLSTKPGIVPA